MNGYQRKKYEIQTPKIKKKKVRLHFITDLHGLSFGRNNECLIKDIESRNPDLILVGGDLFVEAGEGTNWKIGQELVENLRKEYPLYYALGNHEQRILQRRTELSSFAECKGYLENLRTQGVLLDNQTVIWNRGAENLCITGLSLEHDYYKKPFPKKLTCGHMEGLLGKKSREHGYKILLAHNPLHGDAYFRWGSDLILSGHYHGGVIRFNQHIGLISPLFHPFPRYCCGQFRKETQNMLVSAGLGEHTVKLRVHNPRELIEVDLCPASR